MKEWKKEESNGRIIKERRKEGTKRREGGKLREKLVDIWTDR